MTKTTPWAQIKAEFLKGVPPREIAKKYKIKAKTVTDKASKENWGNEKTTFCDILLQNTQKKIEKLTNLALDTLEKVLLNPKSEDKDKVQASKAILDVSGLKSSKKEITGKDGDPLMIKKVFITPDEQKEVKKHIDDVIND